MQNYFMNEENYYFDVHTALVILILTLASYGQEIKFSSFILGKLCKEFFSEFPLAYDGNGFSGKCMILSSDVFDLDPPEGTSEPAGFLDVPSFGESIEKSSAEGISASGRIDRSMDENGRNIHLAFFQNNSGSFFPERHDSDFPIGLGDIGECLPGHTLEYLIFIFVHDCQICLNNHLCKFFSRKYTHSLSWVKDREYLPFITLCQSIEHTFP